MIIPLFTRSFYLLLVFIGIPLFGLLAIYLQKTKKEKTKYLCILVVLALIYYSIPISKLINPKLSTVEKAFQFDYGYYNRLLFKKRYKNTYFVMGTPVKTLESTNQFAGYRKTKNGWKSLTNLNTMITNKKWVGPYYITYFKNESDNITGIFIESNESSDEEKGLNEKTKIKDKYKTNFTYLTTEDEIPIHTEQMPFIYKDASYIYFGIVEHSIEKDYYLEINNQKITLGR